MEAPTEGQSIKRVAGDVQAIWIGEHLRIPTCRHRVDDDAPTSRKREAAYLDVDVRLAHEELDDGVIAEGFLQRSRQKVEVVRQRVPTIRLDDCSYSRCQLVASRVLPGEEEVDDVPDDLVVR